MKKLLLGLGIVTVLALLLWPGSASAASIVDAIGPKDPGSVTTGSLVAVLTELVKWGLTFAAAIGTIFIVINGYQYILSAGNQEKIEKAKMGLTWSVGGLILVISAYAIVYLLQQVLGSKTITAPPAGVKVPGSTASVLENIAQIIFVLGGATAVLFLIIGGYRYVTSQGNPDLIDKAKKTVLYAVIGLIVVFTSALIFNLVAQSVGSHARVT